MTDKKFRNDIKSKLDEELKLGRDPRDVLRDVLIELHVVAVDNHLDINHWMLSAAAQWFGEKMKDRAEVVRQACRLKKEMDTKQDDESKKVFWDFVTTHKLGDDPGVVD